jgi:undecaprenyl pyrophosphate synthase
MLEPKVFAFRAVLNLCVSYTSTHEITSAIQAVVKGVEEGRLSPKCGLVKRLAVFFPPAYLQVETTRSEIDSYVLEKCLYTSECHEVDLLIRTSGEIRLSDFMLWQV